MNHRTSKEMREVIEPTAWGYFKIIQRKLGKRKDSYIIRLYSYDIPFHFDLTNFIEIRRFNRFFKDRIVNNRAIETRGYLEIPLGLVIKAYMDGKPFEGSKKRSVKDLENEKVSVLEYLGIPRSKIIRAFQFGKCFSTSKRTSIRKR